MAFVVGYATTHTRAVQEKPAFWTGLDRVVKEVLEHEPLFVFIDANKRTGRREVGGVGIEECRVHGVYSQDALNDNGERLLFVSDNYRLVLLNTNELVRGVTVHPQP